MYVFQLNYNFLQYIIHWIINFTIALSTCRSCTNFKICFKGDFLGYG